MISIMRAKILDVLSSIYGFVTSLRNALYDAGLFKSYSVPLPVVCVGNLTAGGNAKTPLVRYLVAAFQKKGLRPVILSRGYGGSARGPILVQASHRPEHVGDEPLMLAQLTGVPVVIARKRIRGARYIVDSALGDVIILDDGFQHRRLARNIDIVLVNVESDKAIRDFVAGNLLPAGRFRESRLPALKRAHMLVFADRKIAREPLSLPDAVFTALPPHLQLFRAFLKNGGLHAVHPDSEPLATGAAVIVVTAIANPGGFLESVAMLGFTIHNQFLYRDHHTFTRKDIEAITSKYPNSPIICTEKDLVKLQAFQLSGLYVLRTELAIVPADAFIVQVMKGLQKRPPGAISLMRCDADEVKQKTQSVS